MYIDMQPLCFLEPRYLKNTSLRRAYVAAKAGALFTKKAHSEYCLGKRLSISIWAIIYEQRRQSKCRRQIYIFNCDYSITRERRYDSNHSSAGLSAVMLKWPREHIPLVHCRDFIFVL